MEDNSKKYNPDYIQDIVFSQTVKAGKRIYYLDVKQSRKGDLFLSITESKKVSGIDETQFSFEKHKILLYQEDFKKFTDALTKSIQFINGEFLPNDMTQTEAASDSTTPKDTDSIEEIRLDIDF